MPHDRIGKGSGCNVCAGRQACVCNSLEAVFPALAAEFDTEKNGFPPSEITAWSNTEVWWRSDNRGSWRQAADVGSNRHSKYDTAGIAVLGPSQLLHLAPWIIVALISFNLLSSGAAPHAHLEACDVIIQWTCFKLAQAKGSDGMCDV